MAACIRELNSFGQSVLHCYRGRTSFELLPRAAFRALTRRDLRVCNGKIHPVRAAFLALSMAGRAPR